MNKKRKEELVQAKNRGMTLIELLVAVCILVIVVAPLLHAFYSSALTNRKAKLKLEATTVAENTMEWAKSMSATTLKVAGTKQADGSYVISRAGQQLNSRKYDATIVLDPVAYQAAPSDDPSDPSYSKKYNSQELMEDIDLDSRFNAFYRQPTNMDDQIADQSYPGVYWNFSPNVPAAEQTKDYIKKNMEREIRLKFDWYVPEEEKKAGGSRFIMRAWLTISYTYQYHDGTETKKKTITPISNQKIYEAEKLEYILKNFYLFYEPLYSTSSRNDPNPKEKIVIENEGMQPINVHLIRQNKSAMTDTGKPDTDVENTNYKIELDVIEPGRKYRENSYVTQIRSNLDDDQIKLVYNDGTRDYTSGNVQLTQVDDEGNSIGTKTVNVKDLLKMQGLVAKEKRDHIYALTVKVFKEGESSNELVSITGTKEE
ncbi:MAG: prepilin-type N-terminal cleavage/methylation domain-containing protein [Lachnospiraceae bacterium]